MDKLFKQKQSTSDVISSLFNSSDSSKSSENDESQLKSPPTESEIETLLSQLNNKIILSNPSNSWLTGYAVRNDREWLLRFLIVDKYRVEKAFQRYQSYYTTITKIPHLSNILSGDYRWLIELSQRINETKVFAFYGFDAKNRAILGLLCENLDPQLITHIYGVVYDCLAFFEYFYSNFAETRQNGIVWVVDTEGFNSQHFKLVAFNREFQKLHAKLWCGTVPLTISKVWVCNESKLITAAWKIFKPLLTKKLIDRVEMIGERRQAIVDDLGGPNFTPSFIPGGKKLPEADLAPATLIEKYLVKALPTKLNQVQEVNNNTK